LTQINTNINRRNPDS